MKNNMYVYISLLGILSSFFLASFARASRLSGDGTTVRQTITARIQDLATDDLEQLQEISRRIPLLLKAYGDTPANKSLLLFLQKEIGYALTPAPTGEVHPGIISARAEQFE